jgi:hypothetical protein
MIVIFTIGLLWLNASVVCHTNKTPLTGNNPVKLLNGHCHQVNGKINL